MEREHTPDDNNNANDCERRRLMVRKHKQIADNDINGVNVTSITRIPYSFQ